MHKVWKSFYHILGFEGVDSVRFLPYNGTRKTHGRGLRGAPS